jgi:hypothetical protein
MAPVLNSRFARVVAGVVAILFGVLTVIAGGRALFGDEAARMAVGAAVPFVLWFNFAAGFAYVVAGIGLLMRSRWAVWLSALIAASTIAVFLAFGVHVISGGAYEIRTVGAMALRSLVWITIAIVARQTTRASE